MKSQSLTKFKFFEVLLEVILIALQQKGYQHESCSIFNDKQLAFIHSVYGIYQKDI
jgi:hypothetical protein